MSPEAMQGMSLCWRLGCAPWQRATADQQQPLPIDVDELLLDLESVV